MSDAFFEQYKHPEWQRKRLEALDEAEFTCQRCGAIESQLHVHHKRYVKGRKVWEYSVEELAVLCDSCHGIAHVEKDALGALIAMIHPDGLGDVVALIAGYCSEVSGPAGIRNQSILSLKSLAPMAFHAGTSAAFSQAVIARASSECIQGLRNGED